jgi:uncharacterized protein (TIGR02145 family)
MAENLKTTHFNDGTSIPNVTDNNEWYNLESPAFCWYNNDIATYGNTYGSLYNGYTVSKGKLCPIGWHVPTSDDLDSLNAFINGSGEKLKEANVFHWIAPNRYADNSTGFTALPAGIRIYYDVNKEKVRFNKGEFAELGRNCYWWSCYEYSVSSNSMKGWSLNVYNRELIIGSYQKKNGVSVRCVRD